MRLKKILTRGAAIVLAAVSLTVQTSAMKLIGSGNIYSQLGLASTIAAGITLSEEDAAMRLYYLGMLNGSGSTINGGMEFNLKRGPNRVEAAVFAVRVTDIL